MLCVVQKAKLQQLVDKLRERDAKSEEYLKRRIDILTKKKLKQRTDIFGKIHHEVIQKTM